MKVSSFKSWCEAVIIVVEGDTSYARGTKGQTMDNNPRLRLVLTNDVAPVSREMPQGRYSMVDRRPKSSTNISMKELESLHIDTLDKMLRLKRGDDCGYTITPDASAGGMCMAFQTGVALVSVLKGEVQVAYFTPTNGNPSVILTEEMAQQLLKDG